MSSNEPPPPGDGQNPPPPPPTGGGTPPPPPPPQQPPPGGGYGGPQPSGQFSVGNAFNYGWAKFQANVGPIVLAALAILAAIVVMAVISFAITGAMSGTAGTIECDEFGCETTGGGGAGFFASFIVSALLGGITWLVVYIIGVGIVRAALDITYGRAVSVGSIFRTDNLGQILLAALIIAVATFVGTVLCVIPGILVSFFTQFTLFFLVDKNMPALEAIKASVSFVNRNLGTVIGFYIAAIIAYFIGLLLCGIGALIAIPVIIIAAAYTYRTLQGETVAA